MPPYAVQVTMATQWKGISEEFSNVFHYDVTASLQDEGSWNQIADNVVSGIRPLFPPAVAFRRVRIHGRTDLTKAEDQMRLVKDLSGFGTSTPGAAVPPEMAVVPYVYVGRGPKGGKQFLRKYFHVVSFPGGQGNVGTAHGTEPLTAALKAPFIDRMNALKNISVGAGSVPICTPEGKHLPNGSNWQVLNYTATRQFRRRAKRRKQNN